LERGRVFF